MDGYRTMNENVADSLGLKIAFMAFKKQIFKNDTMKTEKLPGFEEFSAEKLLFYTFASVSILKLRSRVQELDRRLN